jgi:hypothetical protein
VLSKINGFIITCSQSWWKFLLLFVATIATMGYLQAVTAKFPAITAGDIPFDMQNNLTAEQIFTQLEGYSDAAFSLYATFQAVDYFFPIFAGLFLASICAFSLKIASPRYYEIAKSKNLFLLLLIPPVFDWLENINLLWVISRWPEQSQTAATLAVIAKQAKLATLYVDWAVSSLLLTWALVAWLISRAKGRPVRNPE